jgi:Na+/melibiose symporter-like transporter
MAAVGPAEDIQALTRPPLRWTQILAISLFALAFNFHWAALGIIVLPGQVYEIVGQVHKGAALAVVLVPGAFVSLFANPLAGYLSDHTRGWLARWGRRRPYILLGTLLNIAVLVWMASAHDIPSLAVAYVLVQLFSNTAQAPFHALLPDIVPARQYGLTSGVLGLLGIAGTIGGVIISGQLLDSSLPWPQYQRGLWLTYLIIMAIMLALMLVTLVAVHERSSGQSASADAGQQPAKRRFHLSSRTSVTIVATLAALLVVWGMMALWNLQAGAGLQIDGSVQQVVLEVLATVGILRLFDFNPRRDPDFAWVLATRLVMMLGIDTIQTFLEFYMKDAVGVPHPEQAATSFVILVSITSLLSAFAAGWLSDHYGRKRLVYISGFLMALVGVVFVVTHTPAIVITAGALFGLGYGAYQSVDWALVAEVLPSGRTFARDMGVWNIALSLPQVIAPVLGGPIIDAFNRAGRPVQGFQILFTISILYCLLGTVTVRFIRGVRR